MSHSFTLSNHSPLLSQSSSFQPTVSLYDWWLVKAQNDFQGKRLAVAGVSSRKKEAIRVFVSAPIVKRYDVFSLETADGVHVIISGFINEQRTLENGFAPEVFNSFLFGFPPHWESYALDCHREESKAGTDSGNSGMDKEEGMPSSDDNVSAICPEILSDGCLGQETKVATDLENAVTDNDGEVPSSDNVFTICPENLSDGCFGEEETKVGSDQDNAVTDNDGDMPSSDNISTICLENLSDGKYLNGAEKINPTSLVLPEEGPGNCGKPLPEDECSALKAMSGINAANGSGRTRRSARLHKHDIKVCQQKKQPAAESPPKQPDKDQSTTSAALENCDGGLGSPSTPIQSQSKELLSTLSEQLVKTSASRISKMLSAKPKGRNKKKKKITKTEAVSPMRKNIKPASSVKSPQERDVSHLDKGSKQNISLVSPLSLRKSRSGCFEEEPKTCTDSGNAVTDNEEDIPLSNNISTICPEILFDGAEKSIPTFLVFAEEGSGNCEKTPLPENECNVSKEMSGADVAYVSGRNRRSARLHSHSFQLFQQKKQQPGTGIPPKHPDKDHSSTSAALENCDGGLESPSTPIQSQTKGLLNTSEQLIEKSASRFSRTLSAKTEGCNKKSRRIAKTEAVSLKRKNSKPASSVESPQERDVSHLNKGSKQEISLVSPESLSRGKSRSGRLLLPRLEFWRNQIPIYNADHEVTEIQEGVSLASPNRGSPASLSRFNNQKDRNAQHDMRR